jgi:hypothetical protein
LEDATDTRTVEIHSRSGKKELVRSAPVDRIITITGLQGITGASCAGKPCADSAESLIAPGSDTPRRCVRAWSNDNFCSTSKTSRPRTKVVDTPRSGARLKLLKSQAIENISQTPI